ncbi:uncharacterized protein Tco025E_07758 [Trypanosoma conorhini]|uniref:Uncharacterized protein n=1 Tax=Trypanosoma conorhini TaxID=83891 RepID=A0A422NJB5_9TRYP|nr:uncharacterized protein Tco025E_07758 [Trypanosoma conorhini]RNF05552.1 hypothetical protein Tco025E_07758 [Trypanosoma conorhini]
MQRFAAARILPACAAMTLSCRAASKEGMGEKKRQVNLDDDDRWLEAEFDEKIRTPEERYAYERQRELIKSILRQMDDGKGEKLQSKVDEHHEKIEEIKSQMAALEDKLRELGNEK